MTGARTSVIAGKIFLIVAKISGTRKETVVFVTGGKMFLTGGKMFVIGGRMSATSGPDRREDVRDRLEDRIDHNPKACREAPRSVPPGTTPRDAISGFKSEGQFFAALHASKNLNIPFNDLKTQLNTGDNVSLGQAIHTLRPDLSESAIRNATRKAEDQAADTENTAG